MQVYDAKGSPHGVCGDPRKVRFDQIEKGDIFKQGGRFLVKTSTIKLQDRSQPLDREGNPIMKKFNAVQLTGKPGSKSCINDDTAVERYPDAAIYLQG